MNFTKVIFHTSESIHDTLIALNLAYLILRKDFPESYGYFKDVLTTMSVLYLLTCAIFKAIAMAIVKGEPKTSIIISIQSCVLLSYLSIIYNFYGYLEMLTIDIMLLLFSGISKYVPLLIMVLNKDQENQHSFRSLEYSD